MWGSGMGIASERAFLEKGMMRKSAQRWKCPRLVEGTECRQ
jgi:hypothetical protein